MRIDLTQVILALITLISGVVSSFLVPYLKQRMTVTQQERLGTLIRVGVYAAEQLYRSGEGTRKKAYVIQLLESQGYDIDSEVIDARIEAELTGLKNACRGGSHPGTE